MYIYIFNKQNIDERRPSSGGLVSRMSQALTGGGGGGGSAAAVADPKKASAKKRNVISNRTDEDYDDFLKVVVKKSEEHKLAILRALQAHFLFGDLSPSSLRDLVDVMKPRSHQLGEDVIKQGENGEEFFVLVSGTAHVLIEGVGKVVLPGCR